MSFPPRQTVHINLGSITPYVSGPKRAQDRVAVTDMKSDFQACLNEKVGTADLRLAVGKAAVRLATDVNKKYNLFSGNGNASFFFLS